MNEINSLIELLAMLIMDPRTGVLFLLLVMASISDYRIYKIPNWLTLGGVVFGLAYNTVFSFRSHGGFLWALGGLSLGFVIMLPLYALKAMGAGDVKLMAMVGSFLGVPDIFYAAVATFVVGGIAAFGFALLNRVLGRMLGNVKDIVQTMMFSTIVGIRPDAQIEAGKSVGKLPYGVSISMGTIGYVVAKQLGYV